MTPEEATQVLTAITAAWPNPPMTDEQVELWMLKLLGMAHAPVLDAILALADVDEWRPSIARVEARVAADAHALGNRAGAHRALAGPPPNTDRNLRGVASARAALGRRR